MAKPKAIAAILGAAAMLLTLAGCSSTPPAPSTPDKPISIEEAGYEHYSTRLPSLDVIVTCFEDGSGGARVLSCFEGPKDMPEDEIVDFETLGFSSLRYVDAGQGTTVACIEDGSGTASVLTCFPLELEETVAVE